MKKLLLVFSIYLVTGMGIFAQNTIDNPFFDHVPFRGAMGTVDWTEGWCNWNPQNTIYPPATQVISGEITQNTTWKPGASPLLNRASFQNPRLQDPFFDQVTFIGAFGNTDWTQGWCNWTPQTTNYGTPNVVVEGEITSNTTWTANNIYLIKGFLYVRDGATLTIEPGTVIRGDKDTKGSLIIERGAKLIAEGTATQPIVFTSNLPAGSRNYGDWGGVILCGKAAINVPGGEAIIEGGPTSTYGGGDNPDDNDNSGTLRYIRIEFPGIPFVPDKEINGLTLGAVGAQTQIDHIQISYSGDDAFEWFGGTVNAKYLVSFRTWDDDFDTDYGFRGKIQFGVALRDADIADPGSGSNGFESDNDGQGSSNTPITAAIFSNISVFGPKYSPSTSINANFKRALHLRRNTKLSVYNSVFSGFPTGLYIDGTASQTNASNNELQMENCILAGMGDFFKSSFERNYFFDPQRNNDTLATNEMMMVQAPFNLSSPNFLPSAGNTVYLLQGFVYVRPGAKLTILPGTIIRGDKATKGSLIVERGAQIFAEGTSDNPIVFTSNEPAGSRNYGDWGGVILCGKAAINVPGGEAIIEGGPTSMYGGGSNPDDNDNSGILRYVRIEFPGIPFVPDKEINGLTLGAVGSQTQIDHIQVSYCGDDAYEWFGGTVNAKYLVSYRTWDDDFDTDYGFRGMIQYGIALRDPDIADPGSGSNGFESDNDGQGSDNTPQTHPVFSNITIIGPKHSDNTTINSNFKRALHLRRNTATNTYNSVFFGFPVGLYIDGDKAQNNATNGLLNFKNNVLAGMGDFFKSSFERQFFFEPSFANDSMPDLNALQLNNPLSFTNPDLRPLPNSPLQGGSYWDNTGIETPSYQGNLNIFPNPVNDGRINITFSLNLPSTVEVNIYDLSGRMVYHTAVSNMMAGENQLTLNAGNLRSGTYLIRITHNDGSQIAKLIVR
jgi:hypothetical protein